MRMNTKKIDTSTFEEVTAKFKTRARLLQQLGEMLIKTESIALAELVKNSYDADAEIVDVSMTDIDDMTKGEITVKDDGEGMSLDTVLNAWLEPGTDNKKKSVSSVVRSRKYHRLPLGEKGVGRFGVHKLGNKIKMVTKQEGHKEVELVIDWTILDKYKYLDDVPIRIRVNSSPLVFKNSSGTLITITELKKEWDRNSVREIKRSLGSIESPFQEIGSFSINLDLHDNNNWLEGLPDVEEIFGHSLFYFEATIEDDRITDFVYRFTPWETMTKIKPNEITIKDRIVRQRVELVDSDKKPFSIANSGIGSVNIFGYLFDLDAFIMKLSLSSGKRLISDFLKFNGGIRVYRDGMRVYDYGEPGTDWLNLDHRRIQNPSKALSNGLMLTAINLDREQSYSLEEKTNREGFVENESFIKFRDAVLHVLRIVEDCRMVDKAKLRNIYGSQKKSEPVVSLLSEAKALIRERVEDEDVQRTVIKYLDDIEENYNSITSNLLRAAGSGLSMSVIVHEVEKISYSLVQNLKKENTPQKIIFLAEHLSSLVDSYADILRTSKKQKHNLQDIIKQAAFFSEFRFRTHEIEFTERLNQLNRTVDMNKNLVLGCLMNLMDNSIYWLDRKYIEETRSKRKFQRKILITAEETESMITVIVADNGTGFALSTDIAIEPFVTAKDGGIGLGLHIVDEVMKLHNGRLVFPEFADFELPEDYRNGAIVGLEFHKG